MRATEVTPPLGAVGRADLLRTLAVAPREQLALDVDAGIWFGYVRQVEHPAREVAIPTVVAPSPKPPTVPEAVRKLPLRMPFLHAIVERLPRQAARPEAEAETPAGPVEPIDEASARAPSPVRLVGYEDLVPQARLLPALRRLLGATRAGALDLERITRQIAARDMPRYLPRRRFQRWHPELVVLLDFCPRLWPYRHDMHRLAEWLLRQCGRSSVRLRIINDGPSGQWSDWVAHQNPQATAEPPKHFWAMPRPGAPVLIVSDLGLLLGPQSAICQAWRNFIAGLRHAEARPMALAPLGARQLDPELTRTLPVLRWSPDARARPDHAHGVAQTVPEGLDDLLATVAATRRVDPPLLRAMRRVNPRAPLDAGLEGALWCHPDVEAGFAASVRPAALDQHLDRFARLLPRLQAELDALRRRHHAHLRAVLNHQETLLWAARVDPAALDAGPEAAQHIEAAEQFMRRLGATLAQPAATADAAKWLAVAQDIVQHADDAMATRQGELLHPLLAALVRLLGDRMQVPEWADPAALATLLADHQPPVQCWLVRDAASCSLLLQTQPPGAHQSPLGEPFEIDAGGVRLRVQAEGGHHTRWLPARALPFALASLGERTRIQLATARETLTVASVARPRGVQEWRCNRSGIMIRGTALGYYEARWAGDALRVAASSPVSGTSPGWWLEADPTSQGTARFGIDVHGLHADLVIGTRSHGSATLRLRWIEPGTFRMGSPEDEPERWDNEGPQHVVTLTCGFWLADSACTQELWQVVMGSNPSRFTGDPQRPVEQVSWDDVQEFLRALEALLPGCAAGLPTEAEWEYACRAGTDTPFSFGGQITPEQVNYDRDYPYAGGDTGLNRQETVAVKSLPPNGWGLYEMHGNVWEWCADGLRTYTDQPEQDPAGPGPEDKEAPRAVRGGSWIDRAGWARSAIRDEFLPGSRLDRLGFRLCLRSIEPGQVDGRPGRPAQAAPGGRRRGSTPARDEPGSARTLGDRIREWFRPDRTKKR